MTASPQLHMMFIGDLRTDVLEGVDLLSHKEWHTALRNLKEARIEKERSIRFQRRVTEEIYRRKRDNISSQSKQYYYKVTVRETERRVLQRIRIRQ